MAQEAFGEGGCPTGAFVYVVRHGRTPLNAAGVLRGRLDPPLDAVGQMEAASLAEFFEARQVRAVWTSPLRRALETAAPIAARARVPVGIDDRLVDRDYGRWAGWRVLEIEREWGSVDRAPGVERLVELSRRGCGALEDAARTAEGAVVVVSHDAVIRTVLTTLDPRLGDPNLLSVRTGSVSVLERRPEGWSVLDVDRLPADGGEEPVSPPRG